MSAIEEVFSQCRREKRPAFIPFIMAGDPDLSKTPGLLEALAAGGADIIELGVPFSDPIADGPTNQRAATRALSAGTHLSGILRLVARHRDRLGVPIVLFSYFNPIHARGLTRFAEQAASSGVDGVLCVDLPPEEAAGEYLEALHHHRIDPIFLLAPTSTRARIQAVDRASSGFVYYVSRTGVTGVESGLSSSLAKELKAVRRRVKNPLAVGFGISSPQDVKDLAPFVDGIVVGSALVQVIEDFGGERDLAARLEEKVHDLTEPIRKSKSA